MTSHKMPGTSDITILLYSVIQNQYGDFYPFDSRCTLLLYDKSLGTGLYYYKNNSSPVSTESN